MKIQIAKKIGKIEANQIIEVPDKNGVPIQRFWRDRLKDALIDKCCYALEEDSVSFVSQSIEQTKKEKIAAAKKSQQKPTEAVAKDEDEVTTINQENDDD